MCRLEVEAPLATETSGLNVLNAHAFRTHGARPERTCVQDIPAALRPKTSVLNILNARAPMTEGTGRERVLNARAVRIFRTPAPRPDFGTGRSGRK